MIFGIGVDMVENQRLVSWLDKPGLLLKYFSEAEIRDVKESSRPQASLAARFAAKEAFSKAMGTGLKGMSLAEIQTLRDESGQPHLHLCGRAQRLLESKKIQAVHLSLTHEKEYAVAFVVLEV